MDTPGEEPPDEASTAGIPLAALSAVISGGAKAHRHPKHYIIEHKREKADAARTQGIPRWTINV
ncbi:hypothetical protein JG688_00017727 [Phytophthora aleatoria]|uniref:Uncharacterized protein n=1 Tax=Phytophthora aleatoria TaxID=2496075 RepID=A0A8J5I0G8_9STRA|nr:hypothetical protein PI125_g9383 [Phytophthora idaei]KAG3156654.1 hypothetical protein PI126_g8684 [Phytophthora idaei]KAG6943195.1 hypothetical protein JG688_00017727 [Phytophthora aleatoria]